MRPRYPPRGFTLLELAVVLVLLTLAAVLAAPALSRQVEARASGMSALLMTAREAAARRGETMHLRIAESGRWELEGAASAADGPIQAGRVEPFRGLPLTLIVSSVGSCGFDAASMATAAVIPLDPLTCTLRE